MKKILLGLILTLGLASCDEVSFDKPNQADISSQESYDSRYQEGLVTKIVEGDTLYADIDGVSEKIRFIGINTPEIDVEAFKDDYFGRDATLFTTETLREAKIYLEADKSGRDQHSRLLRFVWLDKPSDPSNPTYDEIKTLLVNAMLVEGGYAYAHVYPPDDKYSKELKTLEKEAKKNKIGIWDDKARSAFENGEPAFRDEELLIKGNKNSMIYHLPGGDDYDKIADHNVIYFDSEEEAIDAGFRKAGQ